MAKTKKIALAAAAALLCIAGVGAPAFAQETQTVQEPPRPRPVSTVFGRGSDVGRGDWVFLPPMATVFDRSRPDYGAPGIITPGWRIYPEMGIEATYDDNIFATETNEEEDFVFTWTPAVRIASDWSQHMVGIEGNLRVEEFASESSEGSTQGGASAFGRYDLGEDGAIFGNASYRRTVADRIDPEDITAERTEYDRYEGRAGYVRDFSTINLRVFGGLRRFDFFNATDQDRDRNEVYVNARASFGWSARITPFLDASYTTQDFDDAVDDSGVNRDADRYGIGAGARFDITDLIQAELSAGVERSEFDDPTLAAFTSVSANGSLIWNPTEVTSVIAGLSRRADTTTQAGASGRVDSDISVRVEQEIRRDILGYAEVRASRREFEGGLREDDILFLTAGGEYLLNQYVSLYARYEFADRDTNAINEDFSRNSILVGARLRL